MSNGLQQPSRPLGWAYVVAIVGPTATSLGYLAVHDVVDASVFALALVPSVLAAAVLGGRAPALSAGLLSFVGLNLFHEPPRGWPRFELQELELLGSFALVIAAVIELVHWGRGRVERRVRAEFRWERLDRTRVAVAAGVRARQLTRMVEHELADELDLDMARYEPRPRTTCSYRVGRHGGLYRGGDGLSGLHLRLPAEPVGVDVRFRRRDLGQMVLIPRRSGPVTEDQLLLVANLIEVLAEALETESST